MLLPNIDLTTVKAMLNLCEAFPSHCLPMIGLHPTSVKDDYHEQLSEIETYLENNLFIAIGEVGIDLYWDKTFLDQQLEAFAFQIDLARKYSLPLVIHCRESFAEIIEMIRNKYNGVSYSGVFHSFPGTTEQAKEVIALGFKIGINGVVTFKNSKVKEVVHEIALEHILLETDAPYLTPVPKRGERNESAYLIYIAQQIAEIKKIPITEVARTTTQTSKILFNLD
jgi:TatD DNase family protein